MKPVSKSVSFLKAAMIASLALAGSVLAPSQADACDRCNSTMLEEFLSDRADTPLGRDVLNTMRNHREQPFHGHTTAPLVDVIENLPLEALGGPDARMLLASNTVPSSAADARPLPDLSQALAQAPAAAAPRAVSAQTVAASRSGGNAAANASPPPMFGPRRAADDQAFQGHEFIEILNRDEALTVRPTSTVSQTATPDHTFDIRLHEGAAYIGQGVIYDGFLTNGGIPGPTLVVNEGDIVRMNIINEGAVPHGASIHSVYTQSSKYVGNIAPGETKSITFRASHPGVYMYHCAPGGHSIPIHVLAGQYGMMVVRPADQQYELERQLGRGPDVEVFLLQHEIYASGRDAVVGQPAYTAFNGRVFRYVEEPIVANPGDYVRINYLNVGPNLTSTFHIVGILWDYVYWQGLPENRMTGGQTVTAGPSDSWVIEFRAPADEGSYLMLNHAVGPTSRGAIGILSVSAEAERTPVVMADGPTYPAEELARLREEATRTIAPFGIGSPDVDVPVRYGADTDEVIVRIIGNSYYPKIIEIEPGTTVRWINEDVFTYMQGEFSGMHNAIGIRGPELFSTNLLAHGESASHTFNQAGEYEYMCTPHPYMRGQIIVREPPAPPAEPESGCTAAGAATAWPSAALLLLGLIAVRQRRRVTVHAA